MTIADGFVSSGQNVNGDDGSSLQDYLDEENINEVVVTLDDSELVDENGDYNEFEATAIMENPLVPEVTDQGKIVYWYILEDSYNVSFSETDLVTETTSVMTDKVDAEGGEDEDSDGRDEADDHYGEATIPYYFYWWGEGFPEFEEMNAEIGACVDIDEDGEIDKEDIGAEGETDLDEFVENMKVVKTIENPEYDDSQDPGPYNSEHKVEIVMDDKGTPDTEDDEPVINLNLAGLYLETGCFVEALECIDLIDIDEMEPEHHELLKFIRSEALMNLSGEDLDEDFLEIQRYEDHLEDFLSETLREEVEDKKLPVNATIDRGLKNMPNDWLLSICDYYGLKTKRLRPEREKVIAEYLTNPQNINSIVAALTNHERKLLRYLLDNDGWTRLSAVNRKFGSMKEDSYFWSEEEPLSVQGTLWYKALIMIGKTMINNRNTKIIAIPTELRTPLRQHL